MGPRFVAVTPARASLGDEIDVAVDGLTSGAAFTLVHEAQDPAGPDWAMDVVTGAAPGHVKLGLPDGRIAPGLRQLNVVEIDSGLPVGQDSTGLTVVPAVTGPATPLPKNTPVSLDTVHAASDVEVFLGGLRLADVTFVSATEVQVTIPPATPSGATGVVLRAGKVAGPTGSVVVA